MKFMYFLMKNEEKPQPRVEQTWQQRWEHPQCSSTWNEFLCFSQLFRRGRGGMSTFSAYSRTKQSRMEWKHQKENETDVFSRRELN